MKLWQNRVLKLGSKYLRMGSEPIWPLKLWFSLQIIRLVPGIKIYVSEFALTSAIRKSTSISTLARNLLTDIFTDEALKLCYATPRGGARTNLVMLNQDGVEALYTYVQTYAESKPDWCPAPDGWTKSHLDQMKKSVTKKLNENKKTTQLNQIVFRWRQ